MTDVFAIAFANGSESIVRAEVVLGVRARPGEEAFVDKPIREQVSAADALLPTGSTFGTPSRLGSGRAGLP